MTAVRENDAGTNFIYTVTNSQGNVVDISAATILNIAYKKPDGSKLKRPVVFDTDGKDGKIKYVLEAGIFNQIGLWYYQIQIYQDESHQWSSEELPLTVEEKL